MQQDDTKPSAEEQLAARMQELEELANSLPQDPLPEPENAPEGLPEAAHQPLPEPLSVEAADSSAARLPVDLPTTEIAPLPEPPPEATAHPAEHAQREVVLPKAPAPVETTREPIASPVRGSVPVPDTSTPSGPAAVLGVSRGQAVPTPSMEIPDAKSYREDTNPTITHDKPRGIDLSDGRSAQLPEHSEPMQPMDIGELESAMRQYSEQMTNILRIMQKIILEGVSNMDSIMRRFDRGV